MDRSKIVVIAIVGFIAAGTGAWSWVNLYQSPDYDPEQAEEFAGWFYISCEAEYPDEICNEVIGHHHRDCFVSQVEAIPEPDPGEPSGDIADRRRRGYLDCMEEALDEIAAVDDLQH